MDRLTEVYNDLNRMGTMIFNGSYHLKGECDSVVISIGGKSGVFFDSEKIKTYAQELEAASHEWAHLETGAMYSINAPSWERRKAEVKANRAQIRRVVPFEELKSLVSDNRSISEMAEYFCVSEKMLQDAFRYYTGPCGLTFS